MMPSVEPDLQLYSAFPGNPDIEKEYYSKETYEYLSKQMVQWLARLRMLEGVPFRYLVASEEMLPNESIRFFHIDRNWLDALVDGALSVARMGSQELTFDTERYNKIMRDLHNLERERRSFANEIFSGQQCGHDDSLNAEGGPMTGFLFRSSVVRDFPGIEIAAYDYTLPYMVCSNCGNIAPLNYNDGIYCGCGGGWDSAAILPENPYAPPFRIPTIRQERLSETVMLCIFNGTPTHVRIQEPYEGIRLGVDQEYAEWDEPWEPYSINLKDLDANFLCGVCGDGINTADDNPQCPSQSSHSSAWSQCPDCFRLYKATGSSMGLTAGGGSFEWDGAGSGIPQFCECGSRVGDLVVAETRTYDVFTRKYPQDNSVLNIKGIYDMAKDQLGNPAQDSAMLAIQMLQFPYQQDFNCVNQYPDSVNDQPGGGGS